MKNLFVVVAFLCVVSGNYQPPRRSINEIFSIIRNSMNAKQGTVLEYFDHFVSVLDHFGSDRNEIIDMLRQGRAGRNGEKAVSLYFKYLAKHEKFLWFGGDKDEYRLVKHLFWILAWELKGVGIQSVT